MRFCDIIGFLNFKQSCYIYSIQGVITLNILSSRHVIFRLYTQIDREPTFDLCRSPPPPCRNQLIHTFSDRWHWRGGGDGGSALQGHRQTVQIITALFQFFPPRQLLAAGSQFTVFSWKEFSSRQHFLTRLHENRP